jgi:hypothetical protein
LRYVQAKNDALARMQELNDRSRAKYKMHREQDRQEIEVCFRLALVSRVSYSFSSNTFSLFNM